MKRFPALPMAAVAATLVLAACSSSGGGGGKDTSAAPADSPPAGSSPAAASSPVTASSPAAGSSAAGSSSAAGGTPAGAATITISNFAYSGTLTVKAGEKVKVVDKDSAAHTVTAKTAGKFDTGNVAGGGGTGSFIAPSTPGKYQFGCTYHANMAGTLTVTK